MVGSEIDLGIGIVRYIRFTVNPHYKWRYFADRHYKILDPHYKILDLLRLQRFSPVGGQNFRKNNLRSKVATERGEFDGGFRN